MYQVGLVLIGNEGGFDLEFIGSAVDTTPAVAGHRGSSLR